MADDQSFQNIEITFGALDTKTDPALLPAGGLTLAENATSQTNGIYTKRYGYTALAKNLTSIMRLATLGSQLLACDGSALYSYDSEGAGSGNQWPNAGTLPAATTSQKSIILDQSKDMLASTTALASGVRVDAWIDNSNQYVTVQLINESTGGVIVRVLEDSSGAWNYIHSATTGNRVIVVYASTALQKINAVAIDCDAEAIGASTTVLSGAAVSATNALFDLVAISTTDVLIAWSSNTPDVRVIRINSNTFATTAGPTVVAAETANRCLAVMATAGEFGAVLYHSTVAGGMRVLGFNPATTAVTFAPVMVEGVAVPLARNCGLVRFDSAHVVAVWDRAAVAPDNGYTEWRTVSSAGALGTLFGPFRNSALASKPYTYGNFIVYVNLVYPTTVGQQSTYFTVQLNLNNVSPQIFPVAVHAYRQAPGIWELGQLPDVISPSAGVFRFNQILAYKFASTTTTKLGIASFETDFASAKRLLPLQVNKDALFANGCPVKYDGVSVTENNFLLYPEIMSTTVSAAAGMDNGTRSYIAIFETSDAQGNTAMSTTSIPVSVTTTNGAANNSVAVVVTQLNMTRLGWSNSVQQGTVTLARTTNAPGINYYILQSKAIDPTTATVSFTDTAQDGAITSGRQLYINGGVLDREPPPSSIQMVLHQGRVWGISAADRKVVFYSGDILPGEDIWFSPSNGQSFRVEPGGDLTALASLDDKLIVFEADRIFKVYGRGVNRLGQSSDLQTPQYISTDCGCIEPRSIVQTPDGIMFLSSKGIYLLTRAEQVVYIGAAVSYWTTNYATCASAQMIPDRREVRFSFSSPVSPLATPACVDLVYNYDAKLWTTHLKYAGKTSIDAVVSGTYTWADSAGNVYQENTSFLDPSSTYISMTIETGWLRPAGLQGFSRTQRILFLGENKADHGFELQIAKDYSDAYTMDFLYPQATLATLPGEQVSAHVQDQKGEAFRVRVSDYADGGTPGEAYSARGLLFKSRTIRVGTFEKLMTSGAKA